jgi:hypothetical protein
MKKTQRIRWCLGLLSIPLALLAACQTVAPATVMPPAATEAPGPLIDTVAPRPTPRPAADTPRPPASAPSTSGKQEPTRPAPPVEQPSVPAAQVEKVVANVQADLARRLAIPAQTITVQSVEAVEWPDTSLGCPQPGMMYAQVITPGCRVVLLAAGNRYTYHSDSQGRIVYCEPTDAQLFVSGEPKEAVELAKEDLAQRLVISSEVITFVATIGQEFSADAFYCRATKDRIGGDEPPSVIAGLTILLEAAGRRYEYHASDQEVVFCRQLPN